MLLSTNKETNEEPDVAISIAVWLPVHNGARAVDFYKQAFNAIEAYRMETPDGGLVVKLKVDNAEFWVSGETLDKDNLTAEAPAGGVRMVLTVPDPDTVFAEALKAGATEVFPVGEEYGWRLGRVVDPFGYHWEIGCQLI